MFLYDELSMPRGIAVNTPYCLFLLAVSVQDADAILFIIENATIASILVWFSRIAMLQVGDPEHRQYRSRTMFRKERPYASSPEVTISAADSLLVCSARMRIALAAYCLQTCA